VQSGEHAPSSFTVAIMQPYFIPYAGYFRLFAASDLFVIYDCVQFPRRGWVHRNRMLGADGRECWLTLPLAKMPRDVRIRDLSFSADASAILEERMRRIPLLDTPRQAEPEIVASVKRVVGSPVDYLERVLGEIVSRLGLRWNTIRSSSLDVPDSLRAQDRIIEIARRLGATRYINSPGGRNLYEPERFAAAGIELRFLDPYPGPSSSILHRLLNEDPTLLSDDIRAASETSR
jgi:WbqC-like protein family